MSPYFQNEMGQLYNGDALTVLQELPAESVHTVVTSPPYWGLRDYGADGQLGLEATPEEYIARMVAVFAEVRRVLRKDGTLWLNMGDGYAGNKPVGQIPGDPTVGVRALGGMVYPGKSTPRGLKPKDLIGMPWRLAFALQADGWYLRQDIIWSKPNPMPESVRDRCTKSHEYIFLLSKSPKYYFDAAAIREPLAKSSIARLSQDLENQAGSGRANGGAKANGSMKAVSRRDTFERSGPVSELIIPGQRVAQHRPNRSSGNKARKYGEDRDRPGSHLGASIPWEGATRNKRDVWIVATAACKEAHFATFPPALITPCIAAGAPTGGVVLDPFMGSGTVARVAQAQGRKWVGIEINRSHCDMTVKSLALPDAPLLDLIGGAGGAEPDTLRRP